MLKSKAGYDYDLSREGSPIVKDKTKSQAVTSDNDPIPEVQSAHALSSQSLSHDNNNVNSTNSRIGRSNDTFISPQNIERFDQLAMHGTGYIIQNNRFGLEFINSGEGHQSFGWGLYFTQNPTVANNYRLTGLKNGGLGKISVRMSNGKSFILDDYYNDLAELRSLSASRLSLPYDMSGESMFEAVKELVYIYLDNPDSWNFSQAKEQAITKLQEAKKDLSSFRAKQIDSVVKTLNYIKEFDVESFSKGNVYLADIPENDVLLNWDTKKQTPKVRKAMKEIISKLYGMSAYEDDVEKVAKSKTGEAFYRNLREALEPFVEDDTLPFQLNGKNIIRSDMAASLMLNQAGVPGLRYFDGGSRDEKSGTRNFVIWNTDMIKLLGLTQDSDKKAKQYFRENARTKGQGSYNQIIGVDGARRLDEQENATTRMDNLRIARHMERQGANVKDMWLATGWMRGNEGKWRYEIPYGNIKRGKLNEFRKISDRFNALNDLLENNSYMFTDDDENEFDALEDKIVNLKLSDIFEAPELFSAYPDLRNISVLLSDLGSTAAEYNPLFNTISINRNNISPKELRRDIVHEVQHAIQEREGFAAGTSYDRNTDTIYNRHVKTAHSLWKKIDGRTQRKIREIIQAQDNGDINRMQSLIKALSDKEFSQYNNWTDAMKKAEDREHYLFSKYERHSGETEARNAETRAYMSGNRRKTTPIDRTEDISRDKQIIGRLPRKSRTETYNQIIGYGAALRLDEQNGNHNLIGNLRTAQRMEKKLKPNWAKRGSSEWVRDYSSARKIWNATGWYRGADGQWKFELPYGKIDAKVLERIVRAYDNQVVKLLAYKPYTTTLSSFFDAPELFKAYTTIKNLTVSFEQMSNDTLGYLSGTENKLAVNINIADDADKVREVLIHEIQHWIQGVEGFASGGSTEMAKIFENTKAIDKNHWFNPGFFESKNFSREADYVLRSVSEEQQQIFRKLYEIQKDMFTDKFDDEAYMKNLDMLQEENNEKFYLWSNLRWRADNSINLPISQSQGYWRFAGEVEARNASFRATLSENDRKGKPPFDTQDVSSENQFVFDSNKRPFSRNSYSKNDKEAVDYFHSTILRKLTGNPNETYNQIIGRKGAELIDRAIGTDWLTGNLETAQEMKAKGVKPRTIRRATGWELGHDGKWKYELPDSSLKDGLKLKATDPDMQEGLAGFYEHDNNITQRYISIGYNDNIYAMQSTLIHEIQHAIQFIEGFAEGGSDIDALFDGDTAVSLASCLSSVHEFA